MSEPTQVMPDEPVLRLPAVTLQDPWACLCAAGVKDLESRRGPILSGYRGPLVIHRAKSPGDWAYLKQNGWPQAPRPPWLEGASNEEVDHSLAGQAIGIVLVERTWRPGARDGLASPTPLEERARYHGLADRYLSKLSRASWLARPIPCRGKQGRWWITLPMNVLPSWAVEWGRP